MQARGSPLDYVLGNFRP